FHHHAGTATVRSIVHGFVAIERVVTQVVHVDLKQTCFLSLPKQRNIQRFQILRKDTDNIDFHESWFSSNSPSGGVITMAPRSSSISGTISSTNGSRTSLPSESRISKRSCASPVIRPETSPNRGSTNVY